jgi:hypothetical protein
MKRSAARNGNKFDQLFRAIYQKENAKASKIMEGIRLDKADRYTQGYMAAIAAMLKAREANDARFFIARIGNTMADYARARALLQETRRAHILTEGDAGYMAAWLDYIDAVVGSGLLSEKEGLEKGEGAEQYPGEEPTEEEAANPL